MERLLNRFLAPYFDGISKDGLSVLKGDLQLHNLSLKVDAFDFLRSTGIVLSSGGLGHLRVQIPWRQLMNAKLSIELEALSAYFVRLGHDVPNDEQIFADFQRSKVAVIEQRFLRLRNRAEAGDGDSALSRTSRMGRWMHKLAQNVHITVSGGVDIRCFDTVHRVLGGIHLGQLTVHNAEGLEGIAPDLADNTLQKRCELAGLEAYIAVDGASPQYALAPTRFRLFIDHRDTSLSVRADFLDHDADKGDSAHCGFAVSRAALYQILLILQEINLWKLHVKRIVVERCPSMDADCLEQEVRDEYTRLYRSKLLAGERQPLPEHELARLAIVETVVAATQVARWRLEVHRQMQQTKRQGWFRRRESNVAAAGIVGDDEWRAIQIQVEEQQKQLAKLETPTTIEVVLDMPRFSALVYDDGAPLAGTEGDVKSPASSESWQDLGDLRIDWTSYRQLRANMEAQGFLSGIRNQIRWLAQGMQVSASMTPKVGVFDANRNEWFVGATLKKVELNCDSEVVLYYESVRREPEVPSDASMGSTHDVRLSSIVQEDGADKLSAGVTVPPLEIHITPVFVETALRLVTFRFPPPQWQMKRNAASNLDIEDAMDSKRSEPMTDFQYEFGQWKAEQKQMLRKQAEAAQVHGLVVDVDIHITAPQLTVALNSSNLIHADFGKLRLVAEGIADASRFTACFELTDTQVFCVVSDDRSATERYTFLQPMCLSMNLHGAKQPTSSIASAQSPLEIDADVTLRQTRLMLYPQAAQLVWRMSEAFGRAVFPPAAAPKRPQARARTTAMVFSKPRTYSTPASYSGRDAWASGQDVAAGTDENPKIALQMRLSTRVPLVSLVVFEANSREAARLDVVELSSATDSSPEKVCSSVTLQQVSLVAGGCHMFQTLPPSEPDAASDALVLDVVHQPVLRRTQVKSRCRPVQVAWRKTCVLELVRVMRGFAPPAARKDLHLDAMSEKLKEKVRARAKRAATNVEIRQASGISPLPQKELPPDIFRRGLAAGQDLPPLTAEPPRKESAPGISTLAVDALFGGLVVDLHRDPEEQALLCPAWAGRTQAPLIQLNVVDLGVKATKYSNGEAQFQSGLKTLSLLYDGRRILAPADEQVDVFEGEFRKYVPVDQGGPLHKACFKGRLRRVSVVYFHKHLESLLHYVGDGIVSAVVRHASEEVVERTQKDVSLWNIAIESPVFFFARDFEVLEGSPQWNDEFDLPRRQRDDSDPGEAPTWDDLSAYVVGYPGSIEIRNIFEAPLTKQPPFRCLMSFTNCHLSTVDKIGSASGSLCAEFNWELSILYRGGLTMNSSVGFHFGEICLYMSQSQLALILGAINENITYWKYYPMILPVRSAPAGAEVSAAPAFLGRSTGPSAEAISPSEPELVGVEIFHVCTRIEFEQFSLTLMRSSLSDAGNTSVPLARLSCAEARIFNDFVAYYDGLEFVFEFGAFFNALAVEDLRPADFHACAQTSKLLDFDCAGRFDEAQDNWVLLVDRNHSPEPYQPKNVDVMLVITKISSTSLALRFELGRPRIVALGQLATDIGQLVKQGLDTSSMMQYKEPEWPAPAGMEAVSEQLLQPKSMRIGIKITQAMLSVPTNFELPNCANIEALGSFEAEVAKTGDISEVEHVALSDVVIRRSEAAAFSNNTSSVPSVHLLRLSTWSLSGSYDGGRKRSARLHFITSQVSVRLSALDGPHIFAAISNWGQDGCGRSIMSCPATSSASTQNTPPRCGAPTPEVRGVADGALEICVKALYVGGELLDLNTQESLTLAVKVGNQADATPVPWSTQVIVKVPMGENNGASLSDAVADVPRVGGPLIELVVQLDETEVVGLLTFPVELCLDVMQGRRRLMPDFGSAAYSSVSAMRGDLELELVARYTPPLGAAGRALASAGFWAPMQTVEEFLDEPSLEDFLDTNNLAALPVGSARTRRRSSHGRLKGSVTSDAAPGAVSNALTAVVSWSCEGLEASFLDDCQAKVLPVLRFSMHARGSQDHGGDQGIVFRLNPWCEESQQIGMAIDVNACSICVNYLNAHAGCWEPLLEAWSFDFRIRKSSRIPDLGHARRDSAPGLQQFEALTDISLISVAPLRLNVTPSLCALLGWLLNNKEEYVMHFKGEGRMHGTLDFASGARYRLLNLTGAPVELALVSPRLSSFAQERPGLGCRTGHSHYDDIDWHYFNSSGSEVPLDIFLGHTSAETWRASADEAVVCLVRFAMGNVVPAPPSSSTTGRVRETVREASRANDTASVLISAAGDAILPVPRRPQSFDRMHQSTFVVCEVFSPHPSHKLLMIASPLQVFNHTQRSLEVRFVNAHDDGYADPCEGVACEAAPLALLPEHMICPPGLVGCRHGASGVERSETGVPGCQAPGSPELGVQILPPQHFCAAPGIRAAGVNSVQLRLLGVPMWSAPVPLVRRADPASFASSRATSASVDARTVHMVHLPSEVGGELQFHAHVEHTPLSSQVLDHTIALHLTWPYQVKNVTPVRLACHFKAPAGHICAEPSRSIVVEAFSACDLPLSVPVFMPLALSISLADDRVDGASGAAQRPASSRELPRIFGTEAQAAATDATEELLVVPGVGAASPAGSGEFVVKVTRGPSCEILCSRMLVDRTQLRLRVLCLVGRPTPHSVPLPRVDGHITLLKPEPLASGVDGKRRYRRSSALRFYLAMERVKGEGWSSVVSVNFPSSVNAYQYATLASFPLAGQQAKCNPGSYAYPAHVCLRADAAGADMALGASCLVVSALPQVVVFNELKDETLWVRADGDKKTEICVNAQQSSDFLRWRSQSASNSRASLYLQFRPHALSGQVAWSEPIPLGGRWLKMQQIHKESIALPMLDPTATAPSPLRLFTVDVTERLGVACVTISRGSCHQLRNYSRLVGAAAITPTGTRRAQEKFVARSQETVAFAWTRPCSRGAVHLCLSWAAAAGGGTSVWRIRDIRTPQRKVFRSAGGWHAVVVSTGFSHDATWVCVEDLILAAQAAERHEKELMSAPPVARTKVCVSLANIGISVVSRRLQREILYVDIRQLGLLMGIWDSHRSFDLLVADAQVDCQAFGYCGEHPVLFANRGEMGKPFVRLNLRQQLPTIRGGLSFKSVCLQFDQLEVSITEAVVIEIYRTFCDLSAPLMFSTGGVSQRHLTEWKARPHRGVLDAAPSGTRQVSVDDLAFCGIDVKLWTSMQLSALPAPLRGALSVLTAGSGELSVSGAWLRLSPEVVSGVSGPVQDVGKALLYRHWVNLALSFARVLGRSSLLELPALPVGWARKTLWLGSRGVEALLGGASDMLELCTLDAAYILQKRQEREQQLEHITSLRAGFSVATLHVAAGLWHLGDFVRQPITGACQQGVPGFVTGVGTGLLGTIVKPFVEAGFGARAITTAFSAKIAPSAPAGRRVLSRQRPPRVMHGAGAIREYDEAAALLTLEITMARASPCSSAKDQLVVDQARYGVTDHILLRRSGAPPHTKHVLLLLTATHLLLVELENLGIRVGWAMALSNLRGLRASSHGVVVWATHEVSANCTLEPEWGVSEYKIPCREAKVIRSVCQMLRPLQPLAAI